MYDTIPILNASIPILNEKIIDHLDLPKDKKIFFENMRKLNHFF